MSIPKNSDILALLYDFERDNKVTLLWTNSYIAEERARRLIVTLERGTARATSIFLFPVEGIPDIVKLKEGLYNLLEELKRKEVN